MAKTETVKRIVAHPKLYLRVDSKLQHVPKGTEVTVTKDQCAKLGDKLADPAEQKKLDTTSEGGALTEGAATESEVVKQLTAELKKSVAETKKAQDALVITATDLEKAKQDIVALKAAAKK